MTGYELILAVKKLTGICMIPG